MPLPETLRDPEFLGFDPQDLKRRYKHERDKRVRTDGEQQFVSLDLSNEFSRYLRDDPYASNAYREPRTEDVEFAIIGGGWAGMMTAARLIERGVDSILIIDAAADFGGTWYWNRYPGCECDTSGYIYLPLLEETGYVPKQRFSSAAEILEYAQRIADHFGIDKKALFQTWVTELRWDDTALRWAISTNRGDRIRSRFVAVATGSASRARLPGIPGIADYKGHSFHASRWDYEYTGGGPDGGLDKLVDKRVAIIGTGATAVQCVPHLAETAERLYVVQRTPSPIIWRGNRPTDEEWFASLESGWQARMWEVFNAIVDGGEPDPEVVDEGGFAIIAYHLKALKEKAGVDVDQLTEEELEELFEVADYSAMEQVRRRVDETVADPEKAEALKPWYKLFCKRPTPADEYLPAFNRESVTLLDVSTSKGLDRITEHGIVANGVEHEVDCIIYASGFEITSGYEKRIGIPIFGQGDRSIYDHWGDGMRTMHALTVHGFPNLFMVGGLFAFTLSLNYCGSLDDQARTIAHIVTELDNRGAAAAHPTVEAEEAWIELQVNVAPTGAYSTTFGGSAESCTPGYYNQEGVPLASRRDYRLDSYPLGGNGYSPLLAEWRESGKLEGLEILHADEPVTVPSR